MTSKTNRPDAAELRHRAEAVNRENEARALENLAAGSPTEIQQLLHELRVHQIELEMQNEELRAAQVELETSRARFIDLYDLAPVGYVTISKTGMILEANLTIAALLGVARGMLVGQMLTRFILPEDQDIYYQHHKQLFETGQPQVCELRLLRSNSPPFWARLEAAAPPPPGRRRHARVPRGVERHHPAQAGGGATQASSSRKRNTLTRVVPSHQKQHDGHQLDVEPSSGPHRQRSG